jgi:hypothetical protein
MRVKELNSTGMPGTLVLVDSILVHDCEMTEATIHRTLSKHRLRPDREFFDIPTDVAVAYLQTFSKKSILEQHMQRGRDELQGYIKDIEDAEGSEDVERREDYRWLSISKAATKLSEDYNHFIDYQRHFANSTRDAGRVLYETFCDNPIISVERLDDPVAVSFNDDGIDAWRMGVAEYQFVFNGSNADAQLVAEWKKRGELALRMFTSAQSKLTSVLPRINGINDLIAGEGLFDAFLERAVNILRAANIPEDMNPLMGREIMSAQERDRIRRRLQLSVDLATASKQERDFSGRMRSLLYPGETSVVPDQIGSLDDGIAPLQTPLIVQEIMDSYRKFAFNKSCALDMEKLTEINIRLLQVICEIDDLEESMVKPILDSIIELSGVVEDVHSTYLSFIEEIDRLLKQTRILLFQVAEAG